MPLSPAELKKVLEDLHDFAFGGDFPAFEAIWKGQLEKNRHVQGVSASEIERYFYCFRKSDLLSVFGKLIKIGDKMVAKLFFESGCINIDSLLKDFLEDEEEAEDTLFYKYICRPKEKVFLDLLFGQIPELQRSSFIELFKAEYIPSLVKIDRYVAAEVFLYFCDNKAIDLEAEYLAHSEKAFLQQVKLLQIIYLLLYNKNLSDVQLEFLRSCNQDRVIEYITGFIETHAHLSEEIKDLINNEIIREFLGNKSTQIDKLYYDTFIKSTLLDYQSQLESLAINGSPDTFKQAWSSFIDFYRQYKGKGQNTVYFEQSANLIFKQLIKGGNTELVKFVLDGDDSLLINTNQVFDCTKSHYTDEPFGFFNYIDLAVHCDNLEMVRLLLERGARLTKPESVDPMSACSTLAVAITKQNSKMVAFLLGQGAPIWDKKQGFGLSAIEAAIVSDILYAPDSAYLSLLLSKLSSVEKTKLIAKFKSDYLDWLVCYRKPAAQWTLSFLLEKDYLQVDDLLQSSFYHADNFCDAFLEKIIQPNSVDFENELSKTQRFYLKTNKKALNDFIVECLESYSMVELQRLEKHPIIYPLLSTSTRKELVNVHSLNACRDKPLDFCLLSAIIDALHNSLKEKATTSPRKKVLSALSFYQELQRFKNRVEERIKVRAIKEKIVIGEVNLDEDEIETLCYLLDGFVRVNYDHAKWYFAPLQMAVKKLLYTADLKLREKPKSEENSVKKELPIVTVEQYQERLDNLKTAIDTLGKVDADGRAVYAFIVHLITERNKVEKFFVEKYKVYYFKYEDAATGQKITVALHTDHIPRGKVTEFHGFLDRLIQEYFSHAEIAEKAGELKTWLGKLSGLCIEGRLRGGYSAISGLLGDVPRFSHIMQEAFARFEAYTRVMEPDIVEAMREFKDDDEQDVQKHGQYSAFFDMEQALAFISPYVKEKMAVFEDGVQRKITEADVKNYLLEEIYCDTDNSFVCVSNPNTKPLGDFEITKASEMIQGPFKTEETSGVRLNTTQLNNLILSYLQGPAVEAGLQISHGSIETITHSKNNKTIPCAVSTEYTGLFKEGFPALFIFQAVRDSIGNDKDKNLAFVNEVIKNFLAEHPDQEGTLLIPLMQTGSQFLRKKQHAVLLEVRIEKTKKEIILHNSQAAWTQVAYDSALKKFKFPIKQKHYGTQKDDRSCCLFVYSYIKAYAEMLASTGRVSAMDLQQRFKKVKVSVKSFAVGVELNANFAKMEMPADERVADNSMSSCTSLPWEKTSLLKHFDKTHMENLAAQLTVLDDDLDEIDIGEEAMESLNSERSFLAQSCSSPNLNAEGAEGIQRSNSNSLHVWSCSSPNLSTEGMKGVQRSNSNSALCRRGLFRVPSCPDLPSLVDGKDEWNLQSIKAVKG